MNEETIKKILAANQTAIKQLAKDIKELGVSIEQRYIDLEEAHKTMFRDIKDRWKMISDINAELTILKTLWGNK